MPRKRANIPADQTPDFLDRLNQTINGIGALFGQFQEMRRANDRTSERLHPQPDQRPRALTAYQILGVDRATPMAVIKMRWRKLCAIYHPDGGAADDAMFKKVNAAWEEIRREEEMRSKEHSDGG